MKLADLAQDISCLKIPAGGSTLEIKGLADDSRAVEPGFLFAALAGGKADGMAYAAEAEARGAIALLTGLNGVHAAQAAGIGLPILEAENPRRALALLSARFFENQPQIIAAITGTNGKTSVASFLRQIWRSGGEEAASLGTIGIVSSAGTEPLSHTTPGPIALHKAVARLERQGVTHLAVEASSHGLEQHRLDGVRLSAGAFTNITRDHLDYHGAFEHYLSAKMRLFSDLVPRGAPAVIDASGEGAEKAANAARVHGLHVVKVGTEKGAYLKLEEARQDGFKHYLTLHHEGKRHEVLLPLAGDFQVSNALVAAGLSLSLGQAADSVMMALENLKGAKGRLEAVGQTGGGAPVFIDYAHTPDALAKALTALRPYAKSRLIVVFGCGGDRDKGKRPLMGEAAARLADVAIVTDDNPRSENPAEIRRDVIEAAPAALEIADRARAIQEAVCLLKTGDVLLVAGKGHETGQIIGNSVIPFSDHAAVEAALAAL